MGAKITFDGISEYIAQLEALDKGTNRVIGKAIYDGAGVVADAIRQEIEGLQVTDDKYAIWGANVNHPTHGVTEAQQQGLLDGLGISKMEERAGVFNIKIGFDGYNTVKTKQWPNGQPNAMIARSLESGSSHKYKSPFVRPAVTRVRKEAEAAMAKAAEKEIEKIMEESE